MENDSSSGSIHGSHRNGEVVVPLTIEVCHWGKNDDAGVVTAMVMMVS